MEARVPPGYSVGERYLVKALGRRQEKPQGWADGPGC